MPKKPKLSKSRVAVGYIRVSTAEQAHSGLSLTAQRRSIEAYCTLKGLTLDHVYQDNGVSATIPVAERHSGKRLLDAVRRGKGLIGAVIILKLDRAFRNVPDCLTTVDKWDASGVALHVLDLGGNVIDTASASGRFMLVVLAGAAEMERNLIAERVTSALAVKKSRGEKIGPIAPYGLKIIGGKTVPREKPRPGQSLTVQRGGILVPCKSEQAIMAQATHLRRRGYSARRIATALWAAGLGNRVGKKFHHKVIGTMLDRVA